MDGGVYVEARPNARFATVNLDATFSDCGMLAMQREPVEPAKVTIAGGQVFGPMKKPARRETVMLFDTSLKIVEKVVADEDGKFRFSPQSPGRYLIYASSIGNLPGQREIEIERADSGTSCMAPQRLKLEFVYSD
jgi:hypothetical protein